jgi:hypothetical protein
MIKMWLVGLLIILTLIAIDITVRIGWDRFASGIGSLVDGQRQAEQPKPDPVQPHTIPSRREPPPLAPEAEAPDGVVRQYYADLQRHDVEAARGKWQTPPPRLQDLVQQVDWYRIDDMKLLRSAPSAAQVEIVVAGKRFNQEPEQWGGTIELARIAGAWKIAKMTLTKQTSSSKTSRPTDAPAPELPTQPLPGALPWPGDTASRQGHPDTGGLSRMTEGPRKPPAEPPNWSFTNIPWGQLRSKVLRQFIGAEVTQHEGHVFEPGKYASIVNDLNEGIYTYRAPHSPNQFLLS